MQRLRNKRHTQPHGRNYQTIYMSPNTVAKLDQLKESMHVNGRGRVVERLLTFYLDHNQGVTDENTPQSRI